MTILVATASRHGATAEIGDELARALRERGLACVAAPAEESTPAGYDAVVLGSAVYVGRWLAPARRFADEHRETLAQRPVWLFSSGPVGDPPKPDPAHAVDLDAIEVTTAARAHRVFSGKLDRSRLGPLERTVLRAVHADEGATATGTPSARTRTRSRTRSAADCCNLIAERQRPERTCRRRTSVSNVTASRRMAPVTMKIVPVE